MILKLYEAMEDRGDTAEIVRALSREDILLLADMAARSIPDAKLRPGVERMIVNKDSLFAK